MVFRLPFILLTAGGVFAGSAFGGTAAVLPFANRTVTSAAAADAKGAGPDVKGSTPANMDWIGESIAETIRDALGSRSLVTLSEEVEDAYHQLNLRPRSVLTNGSVLKIGEALDAEQVIYGTFEFTPDAAVQGPAQQGSLKISARIFDRRRFREGSEFAETGSLEDVGALEAHLAWRTLSLLAPKSAPSESEFRSLRPPVRLDAEENYVRGVMARAPEQQEKYYLQAARLDPHFAHPAYELGRIHYGRKEYRQAVEWLQKIEPGEVHYREASFLLGLALFQSADYAGAQKAFQTVADAVPLGEIFNDLGASQSRRNLPQAADSFRKALDGDPNDPVYHFNLGYALWKKGDYAMAADRFRAVLDRSPDDQMATLLLGMCIKKQGPRPGDARLETLERLKTNYEERAYWELKALVDPASAGPPKP
jgi:tetratricopeptide (TPR) repeat protein